MKTNKKVKIGYNPKPKSESIYEDMTIVKKNGEIKFDNKLSINKKVKGLKFETEREFNFYYKGFDDGYNTAVRLYKKPTTIKKGNKKLTKQTTKNKITR